MSPVAAHPLYQQLAVAAATSTSRVKQVTLGLTWTLVELESGSQGLAMTLGGPTRILPWSGSLAGRTATELAQWIAQWNPWEASIGQATLNAILAEQPKTRDLHTAATRIGHGNLAVFNYFLPHLRGKKVAVIGRYPGLDQLAHEAELTVIERVTVADDLPDPACEYLLPSMDWVFLTASSLSNKTFPRLAQLSSQATTVLMGPGTPWLESLADFAIDFLAATRVCDAQILQRTVAEGGGTRIFDEAIDYRVLDLRQQEMQQLRNDIQQCWQRKDLLSTQLSDKAIGGQSLRQLAELDETLSQLDSRYQQLWQARSAFPQWVPASLAAYQS